MPYCLEPLSAGADSHFDEARLGEALHASSRPKIFRICVYAVIGGIKAGVYQRVTQLAGSKRVSTGRTVERAVGFAMTQNSIEENDKICYSASV